MYARKRFTKKRSYRGKSRRGSKPSYAKVSRGGIRL